MIQKKYRFDVYKMFQDELPEMILSFYCNLPFDLSLGMRVDVAKFLDDDGAKIIAESIGTKSIKRLNDPEVVRLKITKEMATPIISADLAYKFGYL